MIYLSLNSKFLFTINTVIAKDQTEVYDLKTVEGRMRKASAQYRLIEDGDRIALGVSGGKDSVAIDRKSTRLNSSH